VRTRHCGLGETWADSSTSMSKERNSIAWILCGAMYGFFCEGLPAAEKRLVYECACAHCRSHSAESISHCGAREQNVHSLQKVRVTSSELILLNPGRRVCVHYQSSRNRFLSVAVSIFSNPNP
jgi:hypothetical protein